MGFGQAGRAQLERDLAETVAALAEDRSHWRMSGARLEVWRCNLEAALAERTGLPGLKAHKGCRGRHGPGVRLRTERRGTAGPRLRQRRS